LQQYTDLNQALGLPILVPPTPSPTESPTRAPTPNATARVVHLNTLKRETALLFSQEKTVAALQNMKHFEAQNGKLFRTAERTAQPAKAALPKGCKDQSWCAAYMPTNGCSNWYWKGTCKVTCHTPPCPAGSHRQDGHNTVPAPRDAADTSAMVPGVPKKLPKWTPADKHSGFALHVHRSMEKKHNGPQDIKQQLLAKLEQLHSMEQTRSHSQSYASASSGN
jgi:hypothetical protein